MNSSSATVPDDDARAPGVGLRLRKASMRASALITRRQGMYGTDETVAELESLINSASSHGATQDNYPAYPTPTTYRDPQPSSSRHMRMRSESSASAIHVPARASSVDMSGRRPRPTQRLTPAQEVALEYRRSLARSPSPPRHARQLSAQSTRSTLSSMESEHESLSKYDNAYFKSKPTHVEDASVAGVKSLMIRDARSDRRSSVASTRSRSVCETASSSRGSAVFPTPPSSNFDSAVDLRTPPRVGSLLSPPSSALLERRRSKPLPPIICDKPLSTSPPSSAGAPTSASTITGNLLTPKIRSTESRAADLQELAEIAARIVCAQGKTSDEPVRCPIPGCRNRLADAKKLALHLHIHELDERIYDPNAHAVRDLSLYESNRVNTARRAVRSVSNSPLRDTFSVIMNALKP
ncbi:hypothetical protein BD626DRAFT_547578 [Schizophyllum amplum]|uniref:C2H2-type domain-containing protein n=1 Tax=Schizophyllum amplum TaxID=97359 RepID=A0A550CI92_9AGAR|nr:hypothetical protein BD626DRAFT_547578 [Auriculariopsis ampla]